MVPICSPLCREARREARRKVVIHPCKVCNSPVELKGKALNRVAAGNVYCSKSCVDSFLQAYSAISSRRMADINRRLASGRMKKNNPMRNESSRAKSSATLKQMGWRPKIQGGNGRDAPIPQSTLATALGWKMEVAIRTPGMKWSCLKADIGSMEHMIAIEVDGNSHCSMAAKKRDEEKTAALEKLGWVVLRFGNQQVMENLAECIRVVEAAISCRRAM